MRRALAVAGLLALAATAVLLGGTFMPFYLAVWLVCLFVPVGALPVVLALEWVGLGGAVQTGYLRWMLALLPVVALAGLPLLFFLPALYPWVAHPPGGFAGLWFTQTGFVVRSLLYLSVWSMLAVAARRPPADAPRSPLCAVGLVLHLAIGTLAAIDWIMSLTPGVESPSFGVLVMSGQSTLAVAVGLLLVPARPPLATAVLLGCLAAWVLLHFTHFLIVWQADRPVEIALYLPRGGPPAGIVAGLGIAALFAAGLLMVPATWLAGRAALTAATGLVVAAQIAVVLWLIPPSPRGGFDPLLTETGGALLVICVLGAGLWALRPKPVPP